MECSKSKRLRRAKETPPKPRPSDTVSNSAKAGAKAPRRTPCAEYRRRAGRSFHSSDFFQLLFQKLLQMQFGVISPSGQKLRMRPLFHNFSLLQNDDEIGILDRGNPVGNQNHRPPLPHPAQTR